MLTAIVSSVRQHTPAKSMLVRMGWDTVTKQEQREWQPREAGALRWTTCGLKTRCRFVGQELLQANHHIAHFAPFAIHHHGPLPSCVVRSRV